MDFLSKWWLLFFIKININELYLKERKKKQFYILKDSPPGLFVIIWLGTLSVSFVGVCENCEMSNMRSIGEFEKKKSFSIKRNFIEFVFSDERMYMEDLWNFLQIHFSDLFVYYASIRLSIMSLSLNTLIYSICRIDLALDSQPKLNLI